MRTTTELLPSHVQAVVDDLVPLLQQLELGRYAIALSGSRSKGTWDERSDLDPHLFYECDIPAPSPTSEVWQPYFEALERWAQRGVTIDGIGAFRIATVDASVARWLAGVAEPVPMIWTIWGFHQPTNLLQQIPLDDPYGIIEGWKQQLQPYPTALKQAVLQKNLASLRYWKEDYHYRNKVVRCDAVFLSGLSSKLIHQIIQIVFALNDTYYAGDGNNLKLTAQFDIQPPRFAERVTAALYPNPSPSMFSTQQEAIVTLITDIEALVTRHAPQLAQLEEIP